MKKNWKIITGVLVVMMLVGFNRFLDDVATGQGPGYKSISAQKGLQIVETEKDVLMLDVRTPQEFTGPLGHIDGAKLIPVQELANRLKEIAQYKDKKVVLVCHSGRRSKIAGNILVQNGFKNVMEIETGMVGVRKLQTATVN
ncbi:MAG: rhodanese-like domain-containing protein [Nitrospinota bacterium]